MQHGQQVLDSYQNPVDGPRDNQSVEAIDAADGRDGVESPADDGYRETAANYAADTRWDSDEDAERLASDVVTGRTDGDAASGESFEDEADDFLFFPEP